MDRYEGLGKAADLNKMQAKCALASTPASRIGSVLEDMILEVAPITALRAVAMELIKESASDPQPLTQADFPFILQQTWDLRFAHAYTHLDGKVRRTVTSHPHPHPHPHPHLPPLTLT